MAAASQLRSSICPYRPQGGAQLDIGPGGMVGFGAEYPTRVYGAHLQLSFLMRVQLQVSGMHCGHCLQAVRSAIAAVPGALVQSIEIGRATVELDESKANLGALIDAIQDAGYEAQEASA